MNLKWTPSAKYCAGSAHIGWAAAAFFAAFHAGADPLLVLMVFAAFVFIKEFWADLTWLENDSLDGSVFDAITYALGGGVGLLGYYHLLAGAGAAVGLLVLMAMADYDGILADIAGTGENHVD